MVCLYGLSLVDSLGAGWLNVLAPTDRRAVHRLLADCHRRDAVDIPLAG